MNQIASPCSTKRSSQTSPSFRYLVAVATFRQTGEMGSSRFIMESFDSEIQESLRTQGTTWVIQGQYHERQSDLSSAIGCYIEALKRRPDSRVAISRSGYAFVTNWKPRRLLFFRLPRSNSKALGGQDRVLFTQTLGPSMIYFLGRVLCDVWESLGSYGWCQLGIQIAPIHKS